MRWVRFAILAWACSLCGATELERARELYQATEYQQVLKLLNPGKSNDPEALLLAGQSAYMLGDFKKAAEYFQRATVIEPNGARYYHWLGKALGRRAETSSFVLAPKLAVECRKAFERAVELDPTNTEAWNDLFEYYLEAPGLLGGGLEKAARVAGRIGELDPVERHYAEARLAEKQRDYSRAEQHWRRAAELAPQQLGRIIDLARFLARQGRIGESDAVFAKAEKVAPESPRLLFARAQTYIETKRNLEEARRLLEAYLKAKLTPEDPPRAEAEKLLRAVSGV